MLSAGTLDPTFGDGGKVTTDFVGSNDDIGRSVAIQQTDGKIVVIGQSDNQVVGSSLASARYNIDGSLDTSFGSGGQALIEIAGVSYFETWDVALQSDGKIVLAGRTDESSGGANFGVVRLNADGSLDTTFDGDGLATVDFAGGFDQAFGLALQSDGKIVVAGQAQESSGNVNFGVVRLNTDGSLDTTFDGDGRATVDFAGRYDRAFAVTIQQDEKIVLSGVAGEINGGPNLAVVRLNGDGSLDNTFDADGRFTLDFGGERDQALDVAMQSDGKIVLGGWGVEVSGGANFAVVRLNPDGTLDTTFDGDGWVTVDVTGGFDQANDVAVQPDGKIVLAGAAFGDFGIMRLNTNGSLDTTFDGDGIATVDFGGGWDHALGLALQSDGKIIAAGQSWMGGTSGNDFSMVRLLGDNLQPVASAGGPYEVDEGGSVQLDASGSSDPNQATSTLMFEWDLDGDGVFGETGAAAGRGDETGIAPTFSAVGYEGAATVSVALRVTDDGGLTDTDSATINVLNVVDFAGRVFDDLDNDGEFELAAGEIALSGVVMELVNESTSGVVASSTTLADGTYEFDFSALGIPAGTYTVREQVQPSGYLDGKESIGNLDDTAADNGTVDNNADSNAITGIVIGAPGTQQDTAGYDFAEIRPSSLQGLVWEDFDDDAGVDFGEIAIEGVAITLSGTDDRGNAVSLSQNTDAQGIFEFAAVRPGTYSISEVQPSGFTDGKDVVGLVNGTLTGDNDGGTPALSTTNDQFTNVVLAAPDSTGINYNFGERVDGGTISSGQTATIGFWQNKNGQRLIESLNGSQNSTLLAEYLSGTFVNMYGMLGDVDRDGDGATDGFMTNVEVADLYQDLFKRNGRTAPGGPPKLDAQVLAVAMSTYITKQSFVEVDFATNTVDAGLVTDVESYGFEVTVGGVGSTFVNVGDNGEAFGVADDSDVSVIDLLLAVNERSTDGLLYDQNGDGEIDDTEELDRIMANDIFSLINEM